jgi:MFS family permease
VTATLPVAPPVAPPLWRNREFRLLWSGQLLSTLGSSSAQLAIPLLVLAITGSPTQAGLVGTADGIVSAIVRLPGGALADRWNRRRIMLVSDGVRLLALGALAVGVLLGRASFGLILAVVGVCAVFDVLFSPAETAALSRLVPAAQLPDAFARNEARTYAATLGGPPLGGLLYSLGQAVPFVADAVSYLVSLLTVRAIRTPLQADRQVRPDGLDAPPAALLAEIRDGIVHVARSPFLRAVLLIAAPLNLAATGAIFATTIVLRQHGTAAGVIGLAQGVVGVGGLLGAFAAAWIVRRLSVVRLIRVVCAALFLALAATTVLTGSLLMVLPLSAGLFMAPAANAALFGRLAATTPDRLQARVISVVMLAATGAAAFAPLAVGLVISHVGGRAALAGCTAAIAASVLTSLLARGIREQVASA